MDIDLDRPIEPNPSADPPVDSPADAQGEPQRKPIGIGRLLVSTVTKPATAMRRLAENPGRRWLAPLLLLAVLSAAATAVTATAVMERNQAAFEQAAAEQAGTESATGPDGQPRQPNAAATPGPGAQFALIGTIFAVVAAVLGAFIGPAITAAVFHFVGTILGGQQSFTQMLAAVSYAYLPLVFRAALRLAYGLIGNASDTSPGLSGLVEADNFLRPVLGQIELWNLWSLALFAVAVHVVSRVSKRKAIIAVLILVGLRLLLGEVGVFAARSVPGMIS